MSRRWKMFWIYTVCPTTKIARLSVWTKSLISCWAKCVSLCRWGKTVQKEELITNMNAWEHVRSLCFASRLQAGFTLTRGSEGQRQTEHRRSKNCLPYIFLIFPRSGLLQTTLTRIFRLRCIKPFPLKKRGICSGGLSFTTRQNMEAG